MFLTELMMAQAIPLYLSRYDSDKKENLKNVKPLNNSTLYTMDKVHYSFK